MESQLDALFIPAEYSFLPYNSSLVTILGKTYSFAKDRAQIISHLRSLFWLTYRKSFPPIVTRTGPTTDAGWGCMHRCGQMMLAEAITRIRLGDDWRWIPGCQDEAYCQLRRLFQDSKCSLYSIQNIAMIGLALDKSVGSWFGPNTVSQVIKKLCAYDTAINWYVHITVEDGLIVDEIKNACQRDALRLAEPSPLVMPPTPTDSLDDEWDLEAFKARFGDDVEVIELVPHVQTPVTRDLEEDFLEVILPPTCEYEHTDHPQSFSHFTTSSETVQPNRQPQLPLESAPQEDEDSSPYPPAWRPLLLFIPLRLGVQYSNPCYFTAVKAALKIPQCIGILGGRPSHAMWIVGVVDDDVLCLDPHFTQPASLGDQLTDEDDLTHHCDTPVRIPLSRLDPSMVLGFLCPTEASFDQLCVSFEQDVLSANVNREEHPLFEMRPTRPFNLPPMPAVRGAISRSKRASETRDLGCQGNVKPVVPQSDDSTSVLLTGSDRDSNGIGEAFHTMRELWSKCNRVAVNTLSSLATLNTPTTRSGSEFEFL